MAKKTDNHNPKAKLDLRRYFLKKYHSKGPIHVFDCCQGSGLLWGQLRKEFVIDRYWGVDLKPKKGRLKIDSVRILQQGVTENVIDIDTYGSPWKHWLEILNSLSQQTTIFLTVGIAGGNQVSLTNEEFDALNLPSVLRKMPGLASKLANLASQTLLATVEKYGTVIEAVEAVSTGNARYLGVHLEPRKTQADQVQTEPLAKQRQPSKEVEHV